MSEKISSSSLAARTFAGSMEQALLRWKGSAVSLLQKGTVAITIASLPGLVSCGDDVQIVEDEQGEKLGKDKADWIHDEGQRDPSMVSYSNSYWYRYRDCGNRGGCQSVDVFLKLRVKPVVSADLLRKRVGVVFRSAEYAPRTAMGSFFTTHEDGTEEWHVRVNLRAWEPHAFTFSAWYQDGAGHTFFDDNDGEQHAVAYDGNYSVIRQDWGRTAVTVDEAGVHGSVSVVLADLDNEKIVRMVWSTDDWRTVHEMAMGRPGDRNVWYFKDKVGGLDVWQLDLDLPGPHERFHYAIVYRHGVRTGARSYEFWDNNGGDNYTVAAH